MRRFREAVAGFSEVIRLSPNYAAAYVNRGGGVGPKPAVRSGGLTDARQFARTTCQNLSAEAARRPRSGHTTGERLPSTLMAVPVM